MFSLTAALALTACGSDFHMDPPREDAKPVWVWTGTDEADVPECPGRRVPRWEGWANEVAPQECGRCECRPAQCRLAPTLSAQATTCAGGLGIPITVDAGDGWNGACAAPAPAIPATAYRSVIYDPPALSPCVPSPTPEPPPISATFARACPADERLVQPVGTAFCITPEGDGSCREAFPVRREFATQLIDHRRCTPCECGEPSGGKCTAHITLYADTACSTQLYSSTLSGTDEPLCQDVMLGAPLAAIRADLTELVPGTCAPRRAKSVVTGTIERGPMIVACCVN